MIRSSRLSLRKFNGEILPFLLIKVIPHGYNTVKVCISIFQTRWEKGENGLGTRIPVYLFIYLSLFGLKRREGRKEGRKEGGKEGRNGRNGGEERRQSKRLR